MTNDPYAYLLAVAMGALAACFATEYLCAKVRKIVSIFKKH